MPIEFAVASHDMVSALIQSAKEAELNHHIGIVQSKDYSTDNTIRKECLSPRIASKWDAWVKGGVSVRMKQQHYLLSALIEN